MPISVTDRPTRRASSVTCDGGGVRPHFPNDCEADCALSARPPADRGRSPSPTWALHLRFMSAVCTVQERVDKDKIWSCGEILLRRNAFVETNQIFPKSVPPRDIYRKAVVDPYSPSSDASAARDISLFQACALPPPLCLRCPLTAFLRLLRVRPSVRTSEK